MPFLYVHSLKSIAHLKRGYPWVFKADLKNANAPKVEPGTLVTLVDASKTPIAVGYYHPNAALACRVLSLNPNEKIDSSFFHQRFSKAHERRERFFTTPYYRLIHAESDQMPGLVIDRFNDTFVCQTNTAGMEKLKPLWVKALDDYFQPKRIIFKDDTPFREKEGLPLNVGAYKGDINEEITIIENGLTYCTHINSQKTGWFYDHRANRLWIGTRAKNKRVLDLYAYQGGFGLLAALQGAKQVSLVDRSENALALAHQTANRHDFGQCQFIQEEVFTFLERAIENKEQYDIVIADPPAFIKQYQYKEAGLRGYQKLAKLSSQLVKPDGLLFIATCSHHALPADFRQHVEMGMQKANRSFQLIRKAGADKDHPIHPLVPETQYLKSLTYQLSQGNS